MRPYSRKSSICYKTRLKTLEEAIVGADVFIGLSQPNILTEKDARKDEY